MNPPLMKNNPPFLSADQLVRSFVAREEDLTFVLDHIAENTGPSCQHLLIFGARGMGKTTLVRRAAHEVRTNPRFSNEWLPLVYAEEAYEVLTAGELWLEGLRYWADSLGERHLLDTYTTLKKELDEQRLYDRALGTLLEIAHQRGKRIVVVVENLHMLLGEQISDADAWRLRKTLQTERRILLVATATASFDAIENSEKAFFDQFRTYRLDPLDLPSAHRVWEQVAQANVPVERMRPLHILTGGNPRLLAILASFASGMSLRDLMDHLVKLVDDHTTYFKSNLESLPGKERKVYVTLADLWHPSTAREVADQARMNASETSALLGRLVQRGVVTASGDGRKKVYELSERMYNIYHLLRRSGGEETRVRAVVDFMVHFYDSAELGSVLKTVANEAGALSEDKRDDHKWVVRSLFQRQGNPHVREYWLKQLSEGARTWEEGREVLREESARIARHLPSVRKEGWQTLFVDIAAAGYPTEALAILRTSPLAAPLEPLVAALQMVTGERPLAPKEVLEVAGDVAKAIHERTAILKSRQASQSDKSDKSTKPDKPPQSDKPDKSSKPDTLTKSAKPSQSDKFDKPTKPDKSTKPQSSKKLRRAVSTSR
ncbi:MAG: AAA family ATPase [Polyangiaceae bacterium]|nr:AAA family ATPase [Polyangiaceae bacterium]